MYVYLYVYLYACVCIYACMYVCKYEAYVEFMLYLVCMYVRVHDAVTMMDGQYLGSYTLLGEKHPVIQWFWMSVEAMTRYYMYVYMCMFVCMYVWCGVVYVCTDIHLFYFLL